MGVSSLYSMCCAKMFKEHYRVHSFKNWNVNWKFHPFKLWINGYYYSGKVNTIQCAFCFVRVHNVRRIRDYIYKHHIFCRTIKIYSIYFDVNYEQLNEFYLKINDKNKYLNKFNKWERSIISLFRAITENLAVYYNECSDSDCSEEGDTCTLQY